MTWTLFKKEPPPKPKTPIWISVFVPIIFGMIVGLVGLVYNGLASDVKDVRENLKHKVDNKTLQLQIEYLKEKSAKAEQYRSLTDKRIEAILLELQRIEVQSTSIKPSLSRRKTIKKEELDKKLIKEKLEFYLKLTPEQKIMFKKLNPEFNNLP